MKKINEDRQIVSVEKPKYPRKDKVIAKLIYLALAIIAAGVGLFVYWAAASEDIIKVNNEPFPNRIVGDASSSNVIIILTTDFCKKEDITGRSRVSFVSSTREIFLPVGKENSPVGCNKREIPIIIPRELPADTYRVKFSITYNINPLKQGIPNTFESQPFTLNADDL